MAVRTIFPQRNFPTVNYDWSEFLEGRGFITFYGAFLPGKMVKYEYYEGTRTGAQDLDADNKWVAQTFTVGTLGANENFYITKITLDLATNTDVKIELQETTAGVPNGTILGVWRSSPSRISDNGVNPEYWVYDFGDADGQNPKLSASTTYAIVMYRDAANLQAIGYKAAGYAGGAKYDSINSGANWTIDNVNELLFRIKGSTKNPYILTSNTVTSAIASTVSDLMVASAQLTTTATFNASFEARINRSAIIDGDAIIKYSLSGGDMVTYNIVKLYHVRGAVETLIGEAEGGAAVEMELTRTSVAPGDKIKLTFEGYHMLDPITASSKWTLAHDGSTTLILHLPFKTDL